MGANFESSNKEFVTTTGEPLEVDYKCTIDVCSMGNAARHETMVWYASSEVTTPLVRYLGLTGQNSMEHSNGKVTRLTLMGTDYLQTERTERGLRVFVPLSMEFVAQPVSSELEHQQEDLAERFQIGSFRQGQRLLANVSPDGGATLWRLRRHLHSSRGLAHLTRNRGSRRHRRDRGIPRACLVCRPSRRRGLSFRNHTGRWRRSR